MEKKDNPKGPIGLLLQGLHLYAAALSPDMTICRHKEAPISINHLPWQHLAIEVEHLAARARYQQVAQTRTLLGKQRQEIDHHVLDKAVKALKEEDALWIRTIMHLGRWAPDKLTAFQEDNDGAACYVDNPKLTCCTPFGTVQN